MFKNNTRHLLCKLQLKMPENQKVVDCHQKNDNEDQQHQLDNVYNDLDLYKTQHNPRLCR